MLILILCVLIFFGDVHPGTICQTFLPTRQLWIMTTKQTIWNPKKTQWAKVPGTVFDQHELEHYHANSSKFGANTWWYTNVQEYWHIIRRLSWSSQKIWNFKGTIDFELVSSYSCKCFSIPKQSGMLTLNWQTPIVIPIWKSSIKIAFSSNFAAGNPSEQVAQTWHSLENPWL